jgi:hypothetical protein
MSTSHEKEINILVNGRPRKVPDAPISYEAIVALAFSPAPAGATVVWSHGNQGGSLLPGKAVQAQNGMKFDVTPTGDS